MSAELRITAEKWRSLTDHLLSPDGDEHAAVLVCGHLRCGDRTALLVQDVVQFHGDDLLDAGQLHLSISPVALARCSKLARNRSSTLVLCHSHPFPGTVRASALDLDTEEELCGRALARRLAPRPVGALVVGPDGFDGRVWAEGRPHRLDRVIVVDDQLRSLVPPAESAHVTGLPPAAALSRVDRQVRAWGRSGQRALHDAHIVVVGCGGTGSHIVAQLTHLGVRRLTVIDDDLIEVTNLSRIVGSGSADVGRAKVDVVADAARRIDPDVAVEAVQASALDVEPAMFAGADLIVCCTDGHGSRALLTELAEQYLVPLVDLGVEVVPGPSGLQAGGGVRVQLPGRGCLHCAGTLDPALVREEYLTQEQRMFEQARGYLREVDEPAPSVIALNGVVASLAVLEICQLFTGVYGGAKQRLLLRAEQRRLTTAAVTRNAVCVVCGDDGLFARGDGLSTSSRWRAPRDTGVGQSR